VSIVSKKGQNLDDVKLKIYNMLVLGVETVSKRPNAAGAKISMITNLHLFY